MRYNAMNMKYIAVVDCNNFFVSCERVFRPDLAGKPVIVLSSNDGCVVARSQEVKDIGVPMGVPYFQVKDIIKDNSITVFSGNLPLYRDMSARVMEIIYTAQMPVEVYSIDEAFIEMTGTELEVVDRMKRLRQQIILWTGIPVSIGIASSKTLAKFASTMAKRQVNNVFFLTDDQWQGSCATVPLTEMWGVGRRLALRYSQAGIRTAKDYCDTPVFVIEKLGGVVALRLWHELQGESVYRIENKRKIPKSLTSSRSFGKKTNAISDINDAVAYHIRHLATKIRHQNLITTMITITLFPVRGTGIPIVVMCNDVDTNCTKSLLKITLKQMQAMYRKDYMYAKVGVVFSGLSAVDAPATHELFTGAGVLHDRANRLDTILDSLTRRFAEEAPEFGRFTKTPQWQTKALYRSSRYTTDWAQLPTARS